MTAITLNSLKEVKKIGAYNIISINGKTGLFGISNKHVMHYNVCTQSDEIILPPYRILHKN